MTAYRFTRANRGRYTVRETAGLFGVGGSAYYRRARYGISEGRKKAGAGLAAVMREIVLRHHRRYGSPRVREELRRVCGKRVSRKKAARLMREYGLNAHRRGKYIPATRPNHGLPVRENILDRRFCAGKPGEKRVSDITYLRTVGGWVYLTVVFDLYDRKVIGWALGGDMESGHTAVPVLETARRKPRRLTRPAISFRPRRAVLLKSVL